MRFTVAELLIVLAWPLIYFGGIVLGLAFWTQRNMDFWMSRLAGHPVHIFFLWDYLLCIFSPLMFVVNVISEIIRTIIN